MYKNVKSLSFIKLEEVATHYSQEQNTSGPLQGYYNRKLMRAMHSGRFLLLANEYISYGKKYTGGGVNSR